MMKKKVFTHKVVPIIFAVALFLLILTVSIGLPIYCRFFYYAHVKLLDLEDYGYSYAEIKQAYDEVLNYLTIPWCEFGTGVLEHSQSGAAHFADCKVLFDLNAIVMVISAAIVISVLVLRKKGVVGELKIGKMSASFYSAVAAIVIPLIIGGLAATDFDKAFEIFHKLFFPGKTNWGFDPWTDEIILFLPQEFFMNCAILIALGIVASATTLIVIEIRRIRKNNFTRGKAGRG